MTKQRILRGVAALFLLATGQVSVIAQDSALLLSPETFLNMVRLFHPVASQASLQVDIAQQQVLAAKGSLDPSLYFDADKKTFDGKNYFNYRQTELKIPTWFGVDFFAGVENNGGTKVNNELTPGKSSYAGLMLPLAKNLVFDKRRATIQQASIFSELSRAERQLMLNDLLMDAIGAYWHWTLQFQMLLVLQEAVRLNEERYRLLVVTVQQGDRAGVDSTEALTQLLGFKQQYSEAEMNFKVAGIELSNFLWQKNNQPYELPDGITPSVRLIEANPAAVPLQPLADYLDLARTSHPKLSSFDFKIDALEVDRLLKLQSLLPMVNLKYNALAKGAEFWQGINSLGLKNNYKYGLEIGMPLFLRQGRGEYKASKLKIQSTRIEQQEVQRSISNKVTAYYEQMMNYLRQINLAAQSLQAYQQIFKVEQMRFDIGESALFLLNSRETKVMEARLKLSEVKAKFFKSIYGVQWAAGMLR